ncbi:mitogen-activated protein kinase kinase kinase 3-like [Forsythia ovata]|uniref:Mitogen-activated protein kinase kinase kinase 3-like n=1 Tax=Forsythia ovata TaxID=205694 RepID=A0ABD1WTW8_9LAMI
MLAWWGKKTSKSENSAKGSLIESLLQRESRNLPKKSRSFAALGKEGGGHPLPRPSASSNEHDHVRVAGSVSGSGSVSSVGSSESSYDPAQAFGDNATFRVYGESILSPLRRSPSQGAKGTTNVTSPLHPIRDFMEIYLLSRLSHVNIVQYYGSDLSEETLSVYLEYVSGGSILKLLQEYGPFAEPVIQNYTRKILLGLAYLHGRNTVHRDIKGANILVGPNGEIKLADFGMAKPINSCSSMLSFKGSPYWTAPEVVTNTNGYSLPVDIWSLGCTVLEMATSKPPWSQYEGVFVIFKIGNSKDIPDIPDHLSNDAKSFIRLCLQREPSARPTASQLLGHPFVRNQKAIRASSVNITREAFPRAFDGSCTTMSPELHSSRTNTSSDRDDTSRPTDQQHQGPYHARGRVRER